MRRSCSGMRARPFNDANPAIKKTNKTTTLGDRNAYSPKNYYDVLLVTASIDSVRVCQWALLCSWQPAVCVSVAQLVFFFPPSAIFPFKKSHPVSSNEWASQDISFKPGWNQHPSFILSCDHFTELWRERLKHLEVFESEGSDSRGIKKNKSKCLHLQRHRQNSRIDFCWTEGGSFEEDVS